VTSVVSLRSPKVSGKEKYKSTCIKEMKKCPASLQEVRDTNCHFTFESIVLLRRIVGSRLAGGRGTVNLNFKLITRDYTLYLQQCWPLTKELSWKDMPQSQHGGVVGDVIFTPRRACSPLPPSLHKLTNKNKLRGP
jgi:hypothetical protein